jgi:selenocysteine lyase/cysteine desulfurase
VTVRRANAAQFRDWTVTQKMLISLRGADLIRFSLHFFNNQDDVDQLIEAWQNGPI